MAESCESTPVKGLLIIGIDFCLLGGFLSRSNPLITEMKYSLGDMLFSLADEGSMFSFSFDFDVR